MALTVTLDSVQICPGIKTGQIAFDTSYPTGGEAMDLSDVLKEIRAVFIEMKGGNDFEYDYDNDKVLAYVTSTGAEVANEVDLHTVVGVRFMAVGVPA